MTGFLGKHAFLCALAAGAFLASDFFDPGALGGGAFFAEGFNFIDKQLASEKAVETLLASFLAFDLNAGRTMEEHNAGGDFVDVLSAVTTGADEGLFNVGFADAEGHHALGELRFFVS